MPVNKGSWARSRIEGEETQDEFVEIAKSRGYEVEKANRHEDRVLHFDYKIIKDGKLHRVEVKGMKRLNRRFAERQDEWVTLEFRGIAGYKGWLYGEADFIAFQTHDGFVLVKRDELVKLAEDKIDRTQWVQRSWEAKYKVYKRYDRPQEMVGMVRMQDLLSLSHRFWKKV